MKLVTAVPSMGLSRLLEDVVMTALVESDEVRVYDNTPEDEKSRVPDTLPVEVVHMPDTTLYGEWNAAAQWAAEQGAEYLALLNDDLKLEPGVLTTLVEHMDAQRQLGLLSVDWDSKLEEPYVVEATSTYSTGGIAGWAFVVRVDRWPGVDPRYRVWYGDDALVENMMRSGWTVGRCRGLYVEHETSTTINQLSWLAEAVAEDEIRWVQRNVT